MSIFVNLNMCCDVCSIVGPHLARIDESGGVIIPEPWRFKGGMCFCSDTCEYRLPEKEQLYPDERLGIGSDAADYYLVCILNRSKTCLINDKYLKIRREHSSILPPGWREPTESECWSTTIRTRSRRGVCPVCSEVVRVQP
jgi:hypothetical protein